MAGFRIDIKGPGVVRATQEAASAGKDIVFVPEQDNRGQVLRVGYFLKQKGAPIPPEPTIQWLRADEVEFQRQADESEGGVYASLDVDLIHPRPNERHSLLFLPVDKQSRVILRSVFRVNRNQTTGFVIQAEIRTVAGSDEDWRPVVRYDCAHGFVHRDMISSDDRKTKKALGTQDTRQAIAFAMDEMGKNLNSWLVELGYREVAQDLLTAPQVLAEMERAKQTLLELHDDPSKMASTKSKFFQVKDSPDHVERIFPPSAVD